MLRVLGCLTQQHNYLFVGIAAIVCIIGCWITIQLYIRTRRSADNQKFGWSFLMAVAAGSSIWTTHFLAMLGFEPGVPHAYEPILTLTSWFIAVGASFVALRSAIAGIMGGPLIGGALFGLGIGAMHYTGMQALQVPGNLVWDWDLVAFSLLFGACLGAFALHRLPRPVTSRAKMVSTGILSLAIVSLHFTGMGAITIVPDPTVLVPESHIDKDVLASGITAIMLIVIGTGIAAYTIDRQSETAALAQYRHLALHDNLTALPNRSQAAEVISRWLSKARGTNLKVAVVGIDLDRFKDVNDVYGHRAGDELLKVLAQRLGSDLVQGEFIARIGGDEFLAVKTVSRGEAEVMEFARRIVSKISTPVEYEDRILNVGASCGVAIFPEDGDTTDDLILRADLAMYRAKEMRLEHICRYSKDMDEHARKRSALSLALREAVAKNELVLHYQPQTVVSDGRLVGFEALLRWNSPDRGLVPPAEFIPIIEETGLIAPIGEWVLETACREATSWPDEYSIAVNVSPAQFTHSDFSKTVHECLLRTGLKPSRLELEITETMLIDDFEHAVHILRKLKALGVRIAMDDFGTGYSSLSTLQAFPLDKLKIDRSFTQNLDMNEQSAMIVRAVINLAKNLHIPVLAEGVEKTKHIDFLRMEECDEAQGFLISRPIPEQDVRAFLANYKAGSMSSVQEEGQETTPGLAVAS